MAKKHDIENPYIPEFDNSPQYLERFFRNLLLGEQMPLHNRDLHISNKDIQSAETEQVPNKHRTSSGQAQDKHRTSSGQVRDKHRITKQQIKTNIIYRPSPDFKPEKRA